MKRFLHLPLARLVGFLARHDASPDVPFWVRLRGQARRSLRRLGRPGILALGVLVACPAWYFSAIIPAQERLQSAQANARSLHERIARSATAMGTNQRTVEQQLSEFYRIFPGEKSSPHWLEKLLAVAENHGLSLDQGEYIAAPDKTTKLVRFQITLPVKGEYLKIRKFLAALPTELPIMALENVQFQRQKIADPVVEAKIRLVLYLGLEA